jgi:putative transposase
VRLGSPSLARTWRQHLLLVQPETVLRWHRNGWRLYWSWKSRTRLGRPRLSHEARDLIARISQENRLWGTERIRGELLKLGICVSNRSIRRYRWRKPTRGGTQAWRTFLSNEVKGSWAADLLVVHTINYRILYVFFFISHERREPIHFNVTTSPTAAWIWQQLLEATPWGSQTGLPHPRRRQRLRPQLRWVCQPPRNLGRKDAASGAKGQLDRGKAR